MMVASTSVPRLMTKPRASSCRLTSAKSFVDRPSLSIVWRNRQIEAWSGVAMSSGRPQKRRNGGRIGERVPLLQKNDLEQRQRRIARRSHRRAVNRRKQSLERRPVEPLLDPLEKASNLPITAHHRIDERRLGQVTARHRIILSEPTSV